MPDNKLFSLFIALTGVEKRECTKLLKSPFFNHKKELLRLWEWMLTINKRKKEGLFTPKEAFKHLFPDIPYDGVKWRHLQSMLTIQIEQLLVQRGLQANALQADLLLAPIYRQKNLPLSLNNLYRRAEERLSKMPQDQDYYHYQYQLEWERYVATESEARVGKKNFAKIGASLDIYLIASKLRLACLMESHRAESIVEYDETFLPELLNYLSKKPLLEIPIIALYYYCYNLLKAGTESDFRAFRRTLEQHQNEIPLEERRTVLLLAINFCIKQLNLGKQRYVREALDLYQTGLETKALIVDGSLSRFAYKNIVALALNLKEFEWAKKFIDEYALLLNATYREANYNYNLARLYFTQKEFKKAMPMLAQIDDSDLLLNLDSRVMLLKMYYETGELDALENLLVSFRILLLRKKKVIGYHQQHYLNMLRYIKKMMRLNPYDKTAVAKFKEEVSGRSEIIERAWILEQLD